MDLTLRRGLAAALASSSEDAASISEAARDEAMEDA
jgi:hypothetical protein